MKKELITLCLAAMATTLSAQYSHIINADNLGRGVVAAKGSDGIFVSWRSLADDDRNMSFDIYRDGEKINATPVTGCTNYTDSKGAAGSVYTVKCIVDNEVVETSAPAEAWDNIYKKIHLDRPEGGISPAGGSKESRQYTYTPDDVSVGDVDGDGEFEYIVKWFPTNAADNGDQFRYTGNTLLDCYKIDGTKLWRIDLGHNIRSGNHYTQFMVYDFDGDGKAELICKTAPGTIDGTGKAVLLGTDKVTDDYREPATVNGNANALAGVVKSGPEYLTVFNGLTGAEINTIYYNPSRDVHEHSRAGWGDANGNRCERYLAGVAYLDGQHPSAIFVRGYYTFSYVWAVDFDGSKLTERWIHKADKAGKTIYGQGTHSLTVGDVDADGFDEIVIGSAAVDHDGSFLHSTGGGHGDALHLGDFIPEREGLEIYMPHEDKNEASCAFDLTLRDARTGEIIHSLPQSGKDVGRALIANVSGKYPGYEYWSAANGNAYNGGKVISSKCGSMNFRIYWDGDLYDELFDGTTISKANEDVTAFSSLINFSRYSDAASCNGTKKTPNLQADLFGDWREEVIMHDNSTQSDLIIFTTTIPSPYKVTCLMQDRQYREAVAWQNVAYNQPPHLSYNLEERFNNLAGITLVSGAESQLVILGDEIQPIEYRVKNAADVETSGLPAGLVNDFDPATGTGRVSGTPETEGESTFTITCKGGADGSTATLSCSLKVVAQFQIPDDEVLASFSFDSASGPAVNAAGGEVLPSGTLKLTEGIAGDAVDFDGSYYLYQPIYDKLQVGKGSFSIELWVKSTCADGYLFCIGTHNKTNVSGGSGNWIGLERLATGGYNLLRFSFDDDKSKTDVQVANPDLVFDGRWHHIVCVRNAEKGESLIYVDGALSGKTSGVSTGALSFNSSELFFIGGDDEPTQGRENRKFTGALDQLAMYSRVLDDEEIRLMYNSSRPSSINSVSYPETEKYTVVNAFSGVVVATVYGEDSVNTLQNLQPGIYIVVVESKEGRKVYKLRR